MKNVNHTNRLLGRKLARDYAREDLEKATGASAYSTMTLRYPPDLDRRPSDGNWI